MALNTHSSPPLNAVANAANNKISPFAMSLKTIADNAPDVDTQGVYHADIMQKLGTDGAIYNRQSGLFSAVSHMTDISAECMSTGFNVWCQSTLSWYVSRVHTPYWTEKHARTASGKILGGTGLSNPMKTFAGVAEIKLKGKKVDGGYTISGILPWVSNVQYNHDLAVIFEKPNGNHAMAIVHCIAQTVEISQPNTFIALEGTATVAVKFTESFVSDSDILSTQVKQFLPSIRSGFILLQMGMGLGIIRRAVRILTEESKNPENKNLPTQADCIRAVYNDLTYRTQQFCDIFDRVTPDNAHTLDAKHWNDILRLRRDVSYATLDAIQNIMLHAGAKGYLQGSEASRTLREGYFVSIITPSLKQLHLMIGD